MIGRYVPRTLRDGPVPGTRRHIPAGRPVRMRAVAAALSQRDGQVLSAGRHRAVLAGPPVPGAGRRRRRRVQGRVHVQGGLHQVVRRRGVLQAVHAGPVRRGQHVQRQHDGHGHGGRVRGRAVRRGQAVLPGRQGLPPGGHAGPVPARPDRAVPGHGQDVHRGRIVPGHVRVRQHARAGPAARARHRDRVVLRVVAVRGRRQRRHVQAVAASVAGARATVGQKTATGRRRARGGQPAAAAAAGPVRPQARYRRVDRPHVQAAVPAGAVRTRRMGGTGQGQGHAEGQGLEDGQVRVPARVHGRDGAGAGRRERHDRHCGVSAAERHAGQVPQHERRVREERDSAARRRRRR